MRTCYDTFEHGTPVPATRHLIESAQGQSSFVDACERCADFLLDSPSLRRYGYRYIDITVDVRPETVA